MTTPNAGEDRETLNQTSLVEMYYRIYRLKNTENGYFQKRLHFSSKSKSMCTILYLETIAPKYSLSHLY